MKPITFVTTAGLCLALAFSAHAALFTSNTSIGPNDTNYDGQDIVVIGCTVTIDGFHNFSDLVIIENGTLTHSPITNFSGGLNLSVTNNVIIEAGSTINVNGLGFGPGMGAGAGFSSNDLQFGFYFTSGGGGGFGGFGGPSFGGSPGGESYGSLMDATNAGSGGGAGFGEGGAGGGLVNLAIGGALVLDGQITANGTEGTNLASGGGSGGGISISAPSVSGEGSVTANGGMGETSAGGGGGGGRIALFFATNDFTGTVSAYGGLGAVAGGAGTIDLQSETGFGDQVLVDNGGASGTNTPLTVPEGCNLTVSGGAIVYFLTPPNAISSLTVGSNSWLVAAPPSSPYSLYLVVNDNALIQAGGGINLNALVTTLMGNSGGSYESNGYFFGGGGGNGGSGGAGYGAAGGAASSGSITQPSSYGSAGGRGSGTSPDNAGGAGGGIITLNVGETLTLNGSITANGGAGLGDGSGGGSGGSVYLTSHALSGAGVISASGGAAGSAEGGGGGGGRIAVDFATNLFTGSVTATGGAGLVYGGAGTIWLDSLAGQPAQLLVDNGGASGATTSLGNGTVLGNSPFNVTVTDGASLVLTSQFYGTFLNLVVGPNSFLISSNSEGTFLIRSNATVAATGGILATAFGTESGPEETGGSYGGYGGSGAVGVASEPAFGSLQEPESNGERGGTGSEGALGGVGGGALSVSVGGTFFLNGTLSANGLSASPSSGAGGGSGGSVFVNTGGFAGNGAISANGGAGSLPTGGGGAGGRIAIMAASNVFTGSYSADGAPGFVGGGAGTVYITTNGNSIPHIIVDNGGLIGTNTPFSSLPICDFTVANGAVAAFGSAQTSFRTLWVGSNGFIIPIQSQLENYEFTVSSNATILPTGGIVFDGKGYAPGEGEGPGATVTSNLITTGGGGGGVAGYGGNSAFGAKGGGSEYVGQSAFGSGGGAGNGNAPINAGGAGGGNLTLNISGTLTLGGVISANGTTGPGEGSGGGGGGSLAISAGTLAGNGSISANGGAGQLPYGGGGGGGEITLVCSNSNQFSVVISAHGGAGATAGGAGIITERQLVPGAVEQVIIDNGGLSGTNTAFSSVNAIFDLIITNGAIVATANFEGSLRNLTIGSNSFLVGAVTDGGTQSSIFNLTGNATILPTGGIVLDGDGEDDNSGVGAGRSAGTPGVNASGSGGGYGGNGGAAASGAVGGAAFGSVSLPESPGSGGGIVNQFLTVGGLGGGSVQMTVTGALTLRGKISANGTAGIGQGGGGGSGGSILLKVGAITGNGSITANGGAGQSLGGGGGGGGRIAVITQSNQFTGLILAQGGVGFANGGAGTVYLAPNANPVSSQLILNNGGLRGGSTPLSPQFVPITAGLNLVIQGGAVAEFSSQSTLNSLLIGPNSFYVQTNPANVYLDVTSNVTVQAGGGIILDGSGYGAGGPGSGTTTLSPLGFITGGGGGHGGYGGNGESGAAGGNVYDQYLEPLVLGSGGGAGAGLVATSAPGGGALQMNVNGTLQMDGLISANGAVPTNEAGGGGSGGSIYITTGLLAGAGNFSANGASGDLPNGGGGGGGRIALRYATNLLTGTIQAHGGPGYVAGGAGTISLAGRNNAPNVLIIDNGGLSGTNTPISETTPYSLTITGAAVVVPQNSNGVLVIDSLLLESNSILAYPNAAGNASFTVLSNAVVQSSASITADGQGYTALEPGPGAGIVTNEIGGGGGHGGAGGAGASGAPGGGTYDSLQRPALWGSAGGVATTLDPNLSQGGGGIDLTVGGTLTINGTISANGNAAIFPGAGGGAGGSIFLSAGLLTGNGILSANGGAGQGGLGGGGGGGRIALSFQTNQFAGTASVSGGAGFAAGQSGTLWLATNLFAPTAFTAPPVPISATVDTQSGNLILQWIGLGGVPFQVQSSTDLIHWQPSGNAMMTSNGPNKLILPVGSDPGTFFRLVPAQ